MIEQYFFAFFVLKKKNLQGQRKTVLRKERVRENKWGKEKEDNKLQSFSVKKGKKGIGVNAFFLEIKWDKSKSKKAKNLR